MRKTNTTSKNASCVQSATLQFTSVNLIRSWNVACLSVHNESRYSLFFTVEMFPVILLMIVCQSVTTLFQWLLLAGLWGSTLFCKCSSTCRDFHAVCQPEVLDEFCDFLYDIFYALPVTINVCCPNPNLSYARTETRKKNITRGLLTLYENCILKAF